MGLLRTLLFRTDIEDQLASVTAGLIQSQIEIERMADENERLERDLSDKEMQLRNSRTKASVFERELDRLNHQTDFESKVKEQEAIIQRLQKENVRLMGDNAELREARDGARSKVIRAVTKCGSMQLENYYDQDKRRIEKRDFLLVNMEMLRSADDQLFQDLYRALGLHPQKVRPTFVKPYDIP